MTDGQSEACELNEPWATYRAWKPHVYAVVGGTGAITYVLRRRNSNGLLEYWCDAWGSVYAKFATATEAEAKLTEILADERRESERIDFVKTAHDAQARYACAMRRAVERHCSGRIIGEDIAEQCPVHADMLNRDLANRAGLTQSQRERIAKLLAAKVDHDVYLCRYYDSPEATRELLRVAETLLREIAG